MDASGLLHLGRDEAPAEDGRARTGRRDQQVQRILDAAKACFVRSGFQGASMQQICAEVGMSPGGLYRYFPSKEAIIEAISAADRKHDAEVLGAMAEAPSVFEGILGAAMAHIRHMHESGDAPLFIEIRAESMRNAAVREACLQCMRQVEDDFRARLAEAIDKGEIEPCVPLDALVPMLMAIGEGVSMSDLPGQGVSFEEIKQGLGVTLAALLRPRRNNSSTNL